MGGNKRPAKKARYIPKTINKPIPQKIAVFSKQWFKAAWASAYVKIGILVLILTIATQLEWVKDKYHSLFTPKSALYEEKGFQHGIRLPMDIIKNSKNIIVNMGGINAIPIEYLKRPEGFRGTAWLNDPFDLRLRLIDDKLVISATFRDFESNRLIGRMVDNEWELKSENFYKYHDGEDNFEILDPSGYVMFNMRYVSGNVVEITGYSVLPDMIFIAKPDRIITIDKTDKQKVMEELSQIKSLNAYRIAN